METVPLTSLARVGGCAAKYAAARLETLVAGILPADAENLLVGLDPSDDAAVYRLDDERALVFTVDFFPALVDDPRTFGAIAAVNALNDVFAMGGAPLVALSVAAFPEELPTSVLGEVLAGAEERVRAAGGILAGGHTIRDSEPKYGLAVVGTVHPDAIWPKAGARPGDALFLTKPLGTGIALQAHRQGDAPDGVLEAAIESMLELDREAAETLRPFSPHAVTDVTGFGLLGHAYETASRSGVRLVLEADALPALPGALELAAAGVRTGGDRRNREYVDGRVDVQTDETREALAYDPQTAGGLLAALAPEVAAVVEATFSAAGVPIWRVGAVESEAGSSSADAASAPARAGDRAERVPAARSRVGRRALPRRELGRVRPRDGLRPRLRELASLRDRPYPEQGFHAFVEFGNRVVALVGIVAALVTWLVARRIEGLSSLGRRAALAALLVALAQIPMGGITVAVDLHPVAVMMHFLLGLAVLGLAVLVVVEAASLAGGRAPAAGPPWLRQVVTWLGLPVCAALVVTGAVATASGPHPGASEDVKRLGIEIADAVYVHVRVAAVFGIGVLVVGVLLWRLRASYPGIVRLWGALLVVVTAQAILGEVQYRNALPWGLVLVHVMLAAAIWALSAALAHVLWRPPAQLAHEVEARVPARADPSSVL